MALMGELSDIGVADLLYLLALGRQSGKLTISANGDEVGLFMHKGQMALVTSSNMTLRLGRMLTRLGILSPDSLRAALLIQEQEEPTKSIGTILIDRQFITEAQLGACVEEQCIEILARVIGAETGIFVYHREAELPSKTEMVPLNADRIVMQASSRTDDLVTLRSLLPAAGAPLMLGPAVDGLAETMSDTEVSVAAALARGPASLGEIEGHLGIEQLLLWTTIVSMRERGLIVAGDPSPVLVGTR